MGTQFGFKNPSADAEWARLSKIWNDRKSVLDTARAERKRILIGNDNNFDDPEVADLDREIFVNDNEVTILKCTLDIYKLTYNPKKTTAQKKLLKDLWEELEQTFQPDKLKINLQHVVEQLKNDGHGKEEHYKT